ncbi:hypothetical protein CNMCM7927_006345 [Aspergillus lentulus]|nr:hypothetical protein CNMCM7927_006345 [Aspergillus lentulus]
MPKPQSGLAPPVPSANRVRSSSESGGGGDSGTSTAPQLAGLFAGGMPKLRSRGGVDTGANRDSPYMSDSEASRPPRPPVASAPKPPGARPPPPPPSSTESPLKAFLNRLIVYINQNCAGCSTSTRTSSFAWFSETATSSADVEEAVLASASTSTPCAFQSSCTTSSSAGIFSTPTASSRTCTIDPSSPTSGSGSFITSYKWGSGSFYRGASCQERSRAQ